MKFCGAVSETEECPLAKAYPNFIPNVIISLKHRHVVLYWYNEAMSIHKAFMCCTREINSSPESNNWRFRR